MMKPSALIFRFAVKFTRVIPSCLLCVAVFKNICFTDETVTTMQHDRCRLSEVFLNNLRSSELNTRALRIQVKQREMLRNVSGRPSERQEETIPTCSV